MSCVSHQIRPRVKSVQYVPVIMIVFTVIVVTGTAHILHYRVLPMMSLLLALVTVYAVIVISTGTH